MAHYFNFKCTLTKHRKETLLIFKPFSKCGRYIEKGKISPVPLRKLIKASENA